MMELDNKCTKIGFLKLLFSFIIFFSFKLCKIFNRNVILVQILT